MKIVVGGQIDKEMVKEVLLKEFPSADIDIKSDIDAAMAMKLGQYDYYFGACNTGGGGALAMAIAILGADKCLTVAMPGNILSEADVEKGIKEGKIAFGFTPYAANQSIEMIKKYIGG
ncbi:DUF2620 domain-containing protein [Pseudostreptobacillus hongkongensis]|uniref:DUF2620 domain-containing protein n=1 Tax=Pseudostreptobacillus hongkongensis TaxID=1162717 RepID=UPI0028D79962|nr:DUF2620 domain-containing protein [Pseudostreptobacillus hongkongensis]